MMATAPALIELTGFHIAWSPTFTLECAFWCAFLVSFAIVAAHAISETAHFRQFRWMAAVAAIALVLRSLVAFVPQSWYFAIANAPFAPDVNARTTVYQPLPNLLILSHLGAPLGWLRWLNILIGAAVAPLLGYVALRAGYSPRTARILALLAAVVPFYVRYSAMDGPQITILFLFAAAATAYVRLAAGAPTRQLAEQVLLVSATVLAAPIRPESTLPLLSVPFFLFHSSTSRPPPKIWHGRATVLLVAAWLVGCAWSLAFHLGDLTGHPGPDAAKIGLRIVLVATMMINPAVVAWVPLVLIVPVWIAVVGLLRRRAWPELISLYAPILFCSIPLVAVGPQNHLPGLGYVIVQSVFVLLASARCTDALLRRVEAGELLRSSRPRTAVAAVALVLLVVSSLPPLTYRYAFQDEFLFLRQALPTEPATVLTISDVVPDGPGDFDCCLLHPYAPLLAASPQLKWIILRKSALQTGAFRDLQFDYYYPGSMAAVDPESVDRFFIRRIARWFGAPEDEEAVRKKAHLTAIQMLDASIRDAYAFDAINTVSTPTHVLSDADFPDGRMSLTLYRRRQ